MVEQTIFCPSGCHKDYLKREPLGEDDNPPFYGTKYLCLRCDWEGEWNNQNGFKEINSPYPPIDIFNDDQEG